MRYRVLPYRQGSKSAKALASALGGKVIRLEGSTYTTRPDDVLINWGHVGNPPSFTLPYWGGIINDGMTIKNASNKLNFFRLMRDAGLSDLTPQFWENRNEIPSDAFPVVCRTVLAGHSGDGIVIADNPDGLVNAPLYVRYVKKQYEYRVHVGRRGDESITIAVQRKARRNDVPHPNWQIRNHANGFIYARGGFTAPPSVLDSAKLSLAASGLDFGAVDVIWNSQQQRAYVLEINTAPGLEGQTVTDYANFFKGV